MKYIKIISILILVAYLVFLQMDIKNIAESVRILNGQNISNVSKIHNDISILNDEVNNLIKNTQEEICQRHGGVFNSNGKLFYTGNYLDSQNTCVIGKKEFIQINGRWNYKSEEILQ